MKQYDIVVMAGGAGLGVILQHDALDNLPTVAVCPFVPTSRLRKPTPGIHPVVAHQGTDYYVKVDLVAAVPWRAIDEVVGSAALHNETIIQALDRLFTGS